MIQATIMGDLNNINGGIVVYLGHTMQVHQSLLLQTETCEKLRIQYKVFIWCTADVFTNQKFSWFHILRQMGGCFWNIFADISEMDRDGNMDKSWKSALPDLILRFQVPIVI